VKMLHNVQERDAVECVVAKTERLGIGSHKGQPDPSKVASPEKSLPRNLNGRFGIVGADRRHAHVHGVPAELSSAAANIEQPHCRLELSALQAILEPAAQLPALELAEALAVLEIVEIIVIAWNRLFLLRF